MLPGDRLQRRVAEMTSIHATRHHCPDCRTPLNRLRRNGDDFIGCTQCGLGTFADAPHPEKSLLTELLPDDLRWPPLPGLTRPAMSEVP